MPVIGYLGSHIPEMLPWTVYARFAQGLKESGYIEGENVLDGLPLG